jgi:ribosomal-protein-serine acetyltransferase
MITASSISLSRDLTLRLVSEADADVLFWLTDANRDYLREWLPWLDAVNSVADTRAFITRVQEELDTGGGPTFAVCYQGRVCGIAGYNRVDHAEKWGSIGYWLAQEFSGRGIMTTVVKAVLEIGFNELGLDLVEIRCATENLRSRKIPERLGASIDRVIADAEWLYDHHVDHTVYQIRRGQ